MESNTQYEYLNAEFCLVESKWKKYIQLDNIRK